MQQFSKLLCKPFLAESDLFFSVGDEELLIVMMKTNLIQACLAAERLRSIVETTTFSMNKGSLQTEIPFTISPGAGQFVLETDKFCASLVSRVDEALYRAKSSGRNHVCLAEAQVADAEQVSSMCRQFTHE